MDVNMFQRWRELKALQEPLHLRDVDPGDVSSGAITPDPRLGCHVRTTQTAAAPLRYYELAFWATGRKAFINDGGSGAVRRGSFVWTVRILATSNIMFATIQHQLRVAVRQGAES